MKTMYSRFDYSPKDVIQDGNRFLLGNGHLGYRGTLEEYGKNEMVALVIAGVYDQFGDAWRENLALPNPFFFKAYHEGEELSVLMKAPSAHEQHLNIKEGVFTRKTRFLEAEIRSERILSHDDDCVLFCHIELQAEREGSYRLVYGMDLDIYEIHGPHFASKEIETKGDVILFHGRTNEGKSMHVSASYACSCSQMTCEGGFFETDVYLEAGEHAYVEIIARVDEDVPMPLPRRSYAELRAASIAAMRRKWARCEVRIEGDEELDFELAYSMYHCLILGDENRTRSIAARGVSGQTYKGAIFWDTEIFLLPFFVLANPKIARNILRYRIHTLPGAKRKAKSLGYEGAFYAWESQDSGDEACRSDNVTDPKTGEPVITYFGTKQIHISADIAYAFDRYVQATGDTSLLEEGGEEVLFEIARFFLSYAEIDEEGLYHIRDVIGPDEYHERVDDEVFTLFMAERVMAIMERYVNPEHLDSSERDIYEHCRTAKWASAACKDGVYAEFAGYFDLEDIDVDSLRKRVVDPKEYWGGKNGIATKTQVIKQADVVSLLALCPEDFDLPTCRKNYEYYFSRTEHGSSLSASMHCLLGVKLGRLEEAYLFLRSSSGIDLRGAEKLFAGGVYIGGTHPAANAGAYLGVIFGFLGVTIRPEGLSLDIHLPSHIQSVTFHYVKDDKIYEMTAHQDGRSSCREVTHHD